LVRLAKNRLTAIQNGRETAPPPRSTSVKVFVLCTGGCAGGPGARKTTFGGPRAAGGGDAAPGAPAWAATLTPRGHPPPAPRASVRPYGSSPPSPTHRPTCGGWHARAGRWARVRPGGPRFWCVWLKIDSRPYKTAAKPRPPRRRGRASPSLPSDLPGTSHSSPPAPPTRHLRPNTKPPEGPARHLQVWPPPRTYPAPRTVTLPKDLPGTSHSSPPEGPTRHPKPNTKPPERPTRHLVW